MQQPGRAMANPDSTLSADLAHKLHVKALKKDYVLEPRLGANFLTGTVRIWSNFKMACIITAAAVRLCRVPDCRRCQRTPGHCGGCQGMHKMLDTVTAAYLCPCPHERGR